MTPQQIIRRPRITEKSVHLQNKLNAYTLEVHPDANKTQVKEAVETLWKVKVLSVNTINCRGKERRVRSRLPGLTAAWKKAIVRIKDGQKLEGV
jgi:large subunit ribosomal protein L23